MNIRELLHKKILIFDGAMGTNLQKRNLTAKDFGGAKYEGCNEYLNLSGRPCKIGCQGIQYAFQTSFCGRKHGAGNQTAISGAD